MSTKPTRRRGKMDSRTAKDIAQDFREEAERIMAEARDRANSYIAIAKVAEGEVKDVKELSK